MVGRCRLDFVWWCSILAIASEPDIGFYMRGNGSLETAGYEGQHICKVFFWEGTEFGSGRSAMGENVLRNLGNNPSCIR